MAGQDKQLRLILVARALAIVALWLLAAGLILPIMTVRRLFFLNETVTIAGMISRLFEEGSPALATIILAFSVLLPVGKLGIILAATDRSLVLARRVSLAKIAELVGKWSMLDVFVVALSLVAIKATGLAEVFDHPGVYFFSAAVIGSMVASVVLSRSLAAMVADDPPVERVLPRHWYG